MSRFEEVKRLKELEEKAKANLPGSRIFFREHMAHAAPWLLHVAEAFRPGDAERLALLVLNEQQRWTDDRWQAAIDCLRRLQAVAEEMER